MYLIRSRNCLHFSFLVESVFLYVFCVVLLCVCTFWVPCCDVRYDFHIETIFGSSLHPVVCRGFMSYLRLLTDSKVQHMLRSVFVLFFFVLCTLCCQFLWIFDFWFSLRYSLTFIFICACLNLHVTMIHAISDIFFVAVYVNLLTPQIVAFICTWLSLHITMTSHTICNSISIMSSQQTIFSYCNLWLGPRGSENIEHVFFFFISTTLNV